MPHARSEMSGRDLLPHPRPRWRWRAARLAALLVAILLFAGGSLAQDATDAAVPTPADAGQDGEKIVGSAWLLPFESLREFEPVTIVILLCSVVAVTLIVQAFLRVRRATILPQDSTDRIEQMIEAKQFRELIEFTETDDSFVSRSLNPALKRAPNFEAMREALETGVGEETAEEFRRLDYINILANVGPLLGLLGTVIGIMDAFLQMRKAGGSADVGALAGGISTALGTTMLGLLLAIPCLIAYGVLRNKADRLTQEGATLSEEFLLMIRPEGKSGSSSSSSSSSAMPSSSSSSRRSGSSSSSSRSSSRSSSPPPAPPTPRPRVVSTDATPQE